MFHIQHSILYGLDYWTLVAFVIAIVIVSRNSKLKKYIGWVVGLVRATIEAQHSEK